MSKLISITQAARLASSPFRVIWRGGLYTIFEGATLEVYITTSARDCQTAYRCLRDRFLASSLAALIAVFLLASPAHAEQPERPIVITCDGREAQSLRTLDNIILGEGVAAVIGLGILAGLLGYCRKLKAAIDRHR